MNEHPWRDEETLRELYIEQDLTSYEVADRLDCSRPTINKWVNRYGIDKDKPWRNKETLKQLYTEENMSVHKIGDRFGVDGTTIHNWLVRHNIETRSRGNWTSHTERRKKPSSRYIHESGYIYLRSGDDAILEHRLLAIAKYGVDAVKNKQVHHKNGIPWDNRTENIELVDIDEHAKIHYEEREIDELGQFV